MRNSDETDAKKILTASLKSINCSVNEAIDVAQNHPLMSAFGGMHS